MDHPICFSNYFINKQNVRSIKNVLNLKLLKESYKNEFLLCVLEDKYLVSELSSEFIILLLTMRETLRNNSKQDFKNYFNIYEEHQMYSKSKMVPVPKEEIFAGCWRALYESIPKNLLGSQQNIKTFKDVVRVVLFSMKNQHIYLKKLIKKWDYNTQPWILFSSEKVLLVLHNVLCWILKYILPAMICMNFFVTTCKIDTNENKLYFFWKSKWQSYYDKKISDMINTKIIVRHEPLCFGKKTKVKYTPQERLQLKAANKDLPKLHIILKSNTTYRSIVRYKNNLLNSSEKYKIKDRLNFLKVLAGKTEDKIETKYFSFYSSWITLKQPILYFVKTDLSNAFGSINRVRLMKILAEKQLVFQKNQQPLYLKKKFTQIYKELIMELRKPLLVKAGATVYKWKEGLVQGYKYSPALSEIYYTYLDDLYFSEHWKNYNSQLKLFTRVVDDYLYITDNIEDAQSFLNALASYRNVNYEKTVVNFPHPTIKFSDEINFLGYSYNTKTLNVNRASNIYKGPMCYKITFSNAITDISKFLENRIGQSGIQINSHLFNLNYNCEELIWHHIFLTLCLSANKFCTILAIICNEKEIQKYFDLYKKRVTVKLCNAMIDTLMKNKPKEFVFMYCINHFRYLSFKALSLCAKVTSKCNGLVPFINIELAKTNCIFGRFREHASRIDKCGSTLYPAIKEVCRRTDLRIIMKQFQVLPRGFECYNYKKFLNDYH